MTSLELMQGSHLFLDCSEQDLSRFLEVGEDRQFVKGQLVFSHGEEARDLILVATGRIELELPVSILGEARNIAFETKNPPEVVGWSALVSPYRFTLSARVMDEGTSVLTFPRTKLNALFDSDPRLGFKVMRNLATIVGQRLQHTKIMWAREIQRSLDERYR